MWKLLCCGVVVLSLAFLGQSNIRAAEGDPPDPNESTLTDTLSKAALPMDILQVLRRSVWKVDVVQGPTGGTRFIISEGPDMAVVPVAVDKPQGLATVNIGQAGLIPLISPVYRSGHMPGDVVSQNPEAGAEVQPNSEVTLEVAQTRIAVQPYECSRDMLDNRPNWGQLIVHRQFDVQLEEGVQHIPMFAIMYEGLHHAKRGDGRGALEARAKCIAERLSIAWDLMDQGGYLDVAADAEMCVRPDDGAMWRLHGPYQPEYDQEPVSGPHAIYVRHKNLGDNPLRIMTVYPKDAELFGQPDGILENGQTGFKPLDTEELAEYLVGLIKAHHLLFSTRSNQVSDYEKLRISKTREGLIFKEIYLRAREVATGTSERDVKDALGRIAMDQRYRLERLADTPPRDWRFATP